jgi:hypothetical protein
VDRLAVHGGSLRLFVERVENVEPSVTTLLREETELGVQELRFYENFASRVTGIREELGRLLRDLKAKGHSLAGYGAAAKGAILINYIGVGNDLIDWVADRNVHKQGRYMPGMHVPIVDPARIEEDDPDYLLILPWNFKDEIMQQQAAFRDRGGRFIVPIPTPEIL